MFNITTKKRRASSRVAQFSVEDVASNVFFFERKLSPSALTNFSQLRRIARSYARNALRSATVQLPGREPVELI